MANPYQFTLTRSDHETIGNDGTAEIRVGPTRVGERWSVEGMSTSTASNEALFTPEMKVFRNGHDLVAGTYNANSDNSSGDKIELKNNEYLLFQLKNGQPGKQWTIAIHGTGYAF